MGYTETPPKKVMLRGNGAQKDPQRAEVEVMGQLWGTEGQKGAVGQSLGRRQGHRTTGKGTRGGAVGHTGRGLRGRKAQGGATLWGRTRNSTPRNSGPQQHTEPPPLMQRLLATAQWGTTAKGGCSSPLPPRRGWHLRPPHPITAPAVGQQEKRGCGGGLCPNWGWWAQSSWDPPALVVPEQRGGPQSFEPQIAARIK